VNVSLAQYYFNNCVYGRGFVSRAERLAAPYNEFVAALCKPGGVLLSELTDSKSHLWHMASGVLGEAAELLQAVREYQLGRITPAATRENVVEELGDINFYDTGIGNAPEFAKQLSTQQRELIFEKIAERGLTDDSDSMRGISTETASGMQTLLQVTSDVVIAAGVLFDQVKKYVIYNKEFNREAVEVERLVLRNATGAVRMLWWSSAAEIEAYNRQKLDERYWQLVYSNQHAQERADKA
jgi:hypothetical protein